MKVMFSFLLRGLIENRGSASQALNSAPQLENMLSEVLILRRVKLISWMLWESSCINR